MVVDYSQPPKMVPFNGANFLDWVLQVERYFFCYFVPDSLKLTLASLFIEGEAREWFCPLYRNNEFLDWDHFVDELFICFRHLDNRQISISTGSQQFVERLDVATGSEDVHEAGEVAKCEVDSNLANENSNPVDNSEGTIEAVADSKLDSKLVDDISCPIDSKVPAMKISIGNFLNSFEFTSLKVSTGCIRALDIPQKIKYVDEERPKKCVAKVFDKSPQQAGSCCVSTICLLSSKEPGLRIFPFKSNLPKLLNFESDDVDSCVFNYLLVTNGLYRCLHLNGVVYFPFDPGLHINTTSSKDITWEVILAEAFVFLNLQRMTKHIRNFGGPFRAASNSEDSRNTLILSIIDFGLALFHWPVVALIDGHAILKTVVFLLFELPTHTKTALIGEPIKNTTYHGGACDKGVATIKLHMLIRLSQNGHQLVSEMEVEKLWDTARKRCSSLEGKTTSPKYQAIDKEIVTTQLILFRYLPRKNGLQGILLLMIHGLILHLFHLVVLHEKLPAFIVMWWPLSHININEKATEVDLFPKISTGMDSDIVSEIGAWKTMLCNSILYKTTSGNSEVNVISLIYDFPGENSNKIIVFDPGGSTFVILKFEGSTCHFEAILKAILMMCHYNATPMVESFNPQHMKATAHGNTGSQLCLSLFDSSKLYKLSCSNALQFLVMTGRQLLQGFLHVYLQVLRCSFPCTKRLLIPREKKFITSHVTASCWTLVTLFSCQHLRSRAMVFKGLCRLIINTTMPRCLISLLYSMAFSLHHAVMQNFCKRLFCENVSLSSLAWLYSNLEDKVLNSRGSIVMNGPNGLDQVEILGLGSCLQLGQQIKQSNKIRKAQQMCVWDPG